MRRVGALAVLAAAALLVVALVEPNLLVGLRSPRALAWTAAVATGCALIGLVARRMGATPLLALGAAALPAAVAAAVFVVEPIVNPRELTEALPTVAATPTPTPTPASPVPAPGPPKTVPPAAVRQATAPATPTRLSEGRLTGLAGHSAKGQVATYRLADGSYVVRFERVDIGGTPDPEVYLLTGRDRAGKQGGLHLGALKAEKGSFHYVLPARFVGTEFTVLVWCERFAVDIAHATLT